MSTVTRLHRAAGSMTLADATRRFLRRDAFEPTTRDAYGRTLTALADVVGSEVDVAAVTTEQLEDDLLERWADAAATTYNRHRSALLSFFGWCASSAATRRPTRRRWSRRGRCAGVPRTSAASGPSAASCSPSCGRSTASPAGTGRCGRWPMRSGPAPTSCSG